MTYFVWVLAGTFLFVMLYIDLFKYFIPNEEYWVGLSIGSYSFARQHLFRNLL